MASNGFIVWLTTCVGGVEDASSPFSGDVVVYFPGEGTLPAFGSFSLDNLSIMINSLLYFTMC